MSLKNYISYAITNIRVSGACTFLKNELKSLLINEKIWTKVLVKNINANIFANEYNSKFLYEQSALVSVVFPVRNGLTNGVTHLIESLQMQTHKNIEYIAVDSGSTDGTQTFLQNLGVNVIEIEPQKFSHSFSRNLGGEKAIGKYILFVVDDAVFQDTEWLKKSIYLLNKYEADSLSTKQYIDEKADVYAHILNSYLCNAQKTEQGISLNYSTSVHAFLHKLLPYKSKRKSLCIDNTNHLTRKKTFDKFKFLTDSVEDIDFAIRLCQKGGKVIYTNNYGILHYHNYTEIPIERYFNRVFLDGLVFNKWSRYSVRFKSQNALIHSAIIVLALFAQSFFDSEDIVEFDFGLPDCRDVELISNDDIDLIIGSVVRYSVNLDSVENYLTESSSSFAIKHFEKIFASKINDTLSPDINIVQFIIRHLQIEIGSQYIKSLNTYREKISKTEFMRLIILFISNRIANYMSRPHLFKKIERVYPCQNLKIEEWS